MSETVRLDDVPAIPDRTIEDDPGPEQRNGTAPANAIVVETWREFASKSTDEIPCIVDGLWPEAAIGFVASPPKKGKTWIALGLALSVATGTDFLSTFQVPEPRSVIYVALEGHRSALTHRLGSMARGMGLNPDEDIPNLHLIYKPRGLNLAAPEWANRIADAAGSVEAQLVIVDVLRAAALLKENSAEDFAALITNLAPLLDGTRSVAFLHHFTKLNENTKERDPGERMSGSGAMYGALDVGIYITGSENGARKLRIAFETRDISSPGTLGVELHGEGSGRNGGLTYTDRAFWSTTEAPEEDDLDASATEIRDWIITLDDLQATTSMIEGKFGVSDKTVGRRRAKLAELRVKWIPGKHHEPGVYRYIPPEPPDDQMSLEEGRQDSPDTCPPSAVSTLEASAHAESQGRQDRVDTEACPPSESADLQGDPRVDSPDSPYGRDVPVSGVSPRDPTDSEQHDDDIPLPPRDHEPPAADENDDIPLDR